MPQQCCSCKEEFAWKNVYLDVGDPRDLVRCQWSWNPRIFVLYRFLVSAYTLVICFYLLLENSKAIVYFTNWGYILLTVTLAVKYIASLKYYSWIERKNNDYETLRLISESPKGTPALLQISWLLSNMCYSPAILISVVYWTALASLTPNLRYWTYQAHAGNVVIVFLEMAISATPMRLLHAYQPFCFGATYIVFNAFYWVSGGTGLYGSRAIYPILDWSQIGVTVPIGVFGDAVAICLLHSLLWCLTKLRFKIAKDKWAGQCQQLGETALILDNSV